ncbi:hypothetical protein HZB02_01005 [Candidatus Woesearchaeota archaeon]|nr:hypothetical protein [Candidatus Woesearchaeota archaeon]
MQRKAQIQTALVGIIVIIITLLIIAIIFYPSLASVFPSLKGLFKSVAPWLSTNCKEGAIESPQGDCCPDANNDGKCDTETEKRPEDYDGKNEPLALKLKKGETVDAQGTSVTYLDKIISPFPDPVTERNEHYTLFMENQKEGWGAASADVMIGKEITPLLSPEGTHFLPYVHITALNDEKEVLSLRVSIRNDFRKTHTDVIEGEAATPIDGADASITFSYDGSEVHFFANGREINACRMNWPDACGFERTCDLKLPGKITARCIKHWSTGGVLGAGSTDHSAVEITYTR